MVGIGELEITSPSVFRRILALWEVHKKGLYDLQSIPLIEFNLHTWFSGINEYEHCYVYIVEIQIVMPGSAAILFEVYTTLEDGFRYNHSSRLSERALSKRVVPATEEDLALICLSGLHSK